MNNRLNCEGLKQEKVLGETALVFSLEEDVKLYKDDLLEFVEGYNNKFTSIGFVCGSEGIDQMLYLCKHIKLNTSYKTIWYNTSGNIPIDYNFKRLRWIDNIVQCKETYFKITSNGSDEGIVIEELTNE